MQQYLEEVRVNAARRKIEEGKKLYEVAREVGYANESTLIKHFKKMTGMTPKEYYEIFKDEEDV
jgi:YesN/AraC family two-component response regulator